MLTRNFAVINGPAAVIALFAVSGMWLGSAAEAEKDVRFDDGAPLLSKCQSQTCSGCVGEGCQWCGGRLEAKLDTFLYKFHKKVYAFGKCTAPSDSCDDVQFGNLKANLDLSLFANSLTARWTTTKLEATHRACGRAFWARENADYPTCEQCISASQLWCKVDAKVGFSVFSSSRSVAVCIPHERAFQCSHSFVDPKLATHAGSARGVIANYNFSLYQKDCAARGGDVHGDPPRPLPAKAAVPAEEVAVPAEEVAVPVEEVAVPVEVVSQNIRKHGLDN